MARPRKSEAQTKREGTYNATRHKGRSANLSAHRPICPDWLTGRARVIFEESVGYLEKAEILSLADASLVAHYAILEAKFQKDPDEFSAALHGQLRLLRAEAGMTPQGRLKIDGTPSEKEDDPAEEFFH